MERLQDASAVDVCTLFLASSPRLIKSSSVVLDFVQNIEYIYV